MNQKSYEEAVKRLEEVIELLEGKDVTLDDSLKLFQEGIELYRFCNGKLTEVEEKISLVIETNKGYEEKSFMLDNTEV
ncbi:exodeoxyribonuclease VII small subunit [Serpentinicella alkaliphila]|uniref:Exodeoxyribonuclease 7 small subunit n=1 Tax=Serpentinicella alkaliphila TaxID=1734049 RepID=A0A4R2U5C8_9FIRM|nr:exodeoxyribonuclease VII small subunit [Serpentinicella alkaliphila]QUH26639.1 exodeoxyribonuclease VII small subunit [Serpentinicella alkaliphila]TCQ02893.1 exodeoxyribonuclease VII small subunit [Serpentinicella alkaliphila]